MAYNFEYQRMMAEQLEDALHLLDMTDQEFSRLSGINRRNLQRMLKGDADIPHWVGALLGAMTVSDARRIVEGYADAALVKPEAA